MLAGTTDKPTIDERYSSAVNTSNMAVNPRTSMSDTDVLAAMGIADRELTQGVTSQGDPVRPAPLAVALARLLEGGDPRAAHAIVRALADMAWHQARVQDVKLTHAQAKDMARAVLAWLRHGVCHPCGGHGYTLIQGTKTIGDATCPHCEGTGKRPLEAEFRAPLRELVSWLVSEVQREAGRAGPRAMSKLSTRMDLG